MNLQLKFEESLKLFALEGEGNKLLPSFDDFEQVAKRLGKLVTQSKSNFITGLLLLKSNVKVNLTLAEIIEIVKDNGFGEIYNIQVLEMMLTIHREEFADIFNDYTDKKKLEKVNLPYFNDIKNNSMPIQKELLQWLFSKHNYYNLAYVPNLIKLFISMSKDFNSNYLTLLNSLNEFNEKQVDLLISRINEYQNSKQAYSVKNFAYFLFPEFIKTLELAEKKYVFGYKLGYSFDVLNKHREANTNFYQLICDLDDNKTNVLFTTLLRPEVYGGETMVSLNLIDKHFDLINADKPFWSTLYKKINGKENAVAFKHLVEILNKVDEERLKKNLSSKMSSEELLLIVDELIETYNKNPHSNSLDGISDANFFDESDLPF